MALYVVATPIGNLEDLSSRALKILQSVPVVLMEKWTDSIKLLNHFQIKPQTILVYNDANRRKTTPKILLMLKSRDAVLLTSAGTPGVSDPGPDLVLTCRKAGIQVIPVPGPSALTAAISASGLRGNFLFVSFLPLKKSHVRRMLDEAKANGHNLVFFESPFRIVKTLEFIGEHFPEARVFVAKELTKVFERCFFGRPAEILEAAKNDKNFAKGEFTLILTFEVL